MGGNICASNYGGGGVWTFSIILIMTKLEKTKILDENNIEHYIDNSGTLMALCKMSTFTGDDCSEWIDASEMIEMIQQQERYFKR